MPALPRQLGLSLIESMVSLVILAFGIMGLLGAQLRTLMDQQQGVQRATAMRLSDELFEKVKANPQNILDSNDPLSNTQWSWITQYEMTWNSSPSANPDCIANACSGNQKAQFDIRQWRQRVVNALPGGNASIQVSPDSARQLIVIIGWPLKESGSANGLLSPFALNIPNVTTPSACGSTHMCYVAFGQP